MVIGGETSLCGEVETGGVAEPGKEFACVGCCKDGATADVPEPALVGLGGFARGIPTNNLSEKP